MIAFAVPVPVPAAPIEPALPCERPVYMFGADTVLGRGVRGASVADRLLTFFARVCRAPIDFETIAVEGGQLLPQLDTVIARLLEGRPSVAFVHLPFGDVASGAKVDNLIEAYARLLATCVSSDSICLIGGQQPVNSFTNEMTERQAELERRASAAFAANYMRLYPYMESEAPGRRLMLPLDSKDGQFVNDYGHELLFALYRNLLLERTGSVQ